MDEAQEIADAKEDAIRECLRKQLEEFELLRSIYCHTGEFMTDDSKVIYEIAEFLNDERSSIERNLDYRIKFDINSAIKCELAVELTKLYPLHGTPIITIRTNSLSNKEEAFLKKTLVEYIDEFVDKTEPYVFQIISWLQDNTVAVTMKMKKAIMDAKREIQIDNENLNSSESGKKK